jgi:hypothetical protein
MTILEVCAELRADCKPYALIRMRRNTFSQTLKRIEGGRCKPATVKGFFGKLGYTGDFNEWSRVVKANTSNQPQP